MDDPNQIGASFEKLVEEQLSSLSKRFPSNVQYKSQTSLQLLDGQIVIPDFELIIDLPHEESHYLIECQNRKRSSPQIAHKIRYMKSLSNYNTVIFVYRDSIPEATRSTLETDGVILHSYSSFTLLTQSIAETVRPFHEKERLEQDTESAFRGRAGSASRRRRKKGRRQCRQCKQVRRARPIRLTVDQKRDAMQGLVCCKCGKEFKRFI